MSRAHLRQHEKEQEKEQEKLGELAASRAAKRARAEQGVCQGAPVRAKRPRSGTGAGDEQAARSGPADAAARARAARGGLQVSRRSRPSGRGATLGCWSGCWWRYLCDAELKEGRAALLPTAWPVLLPRPRDPLYCPPTAWPGLRHGPRLAPRDSPPEGAGLREREGGSSTSGRPARLPAGLPLTSRLELTLWQGPCIRWCASSVCSVHFAHSHRTLALAVTRRECCGRMPHVRRPSAQSLRGPPG